VATTRKREATGYVKLHDNDDNVLPKGWITTTNKKSPSHICLGQKFRVNTSGNSGLPVVFSSEAHPQRVGVSFHAVEIDHIHHGGGVV
jgi:hypothetical protein